MFGGESHDLLQEMSIFDLSSLSWIFASNKSSITPRKGHCAVAFDDKSMLIFGGQIGKEEFSNELFNWNFLSHSWSNLSWKDNTTVTARTGATMNKISNSSISILGGHNGNWTIGELEIFEMESFSKWKKTFAFQLPGQISLTYHTSVTVSNQLYVFGGLMNFWDISSAVNSIFHFDFEQNEWVSNEIQGAFPLARFQHSAVVSTQEGTPFMLVFGGQDRNGNFLKDISKFDISTHSWKFIPQEGFVPSPRGGVTSVVAFNVMYTFGGKLSPSAKTNEIIAFRVPTEENQRNVALIVGLTFGLLFCCVGALLGFFLYRNYIKNKWKPIPNQPLTEEMKYAPPPIVAPYCSLCFESEINVVLLPCKHQVNFPSHFLSFYFFFSFLKTSFFKKPQVICKSCASTCSKCPLCNESIVNVITKKISNSIKF